MIDSHCHLDQDPLLENLNDVIKRSKNVGITKLLTICTTLDSFEKIKTIIKKDNKDRLNTIVYTSLEIIRKVSYMLYPIIPDTIEKALKIFNLNPADISFESIGIHDYLKPGNDLNKISILFKKIEKTND